MALALWQGEFCHYRPLIERILAQTERRVLGGEAVPACEKIVSLFEPHADIIVKGSRDVEYGHKLNLTTGRSGADPDEKIFELPIGALELAFRSASSIESSPDAVRMMRG